MIVRQSDFMNIHATRSWTPFHSLFNSFVRLTEVYCCSTTLKIVSNDFRFHLLKCIDN